MLLTCLWHTVHISSPHVHVTTNMNGLGMRIRLVPVVYCEDKKLAKVGI